MARFLAILFWSVICLLVIALTVPNLHEATINYYVGSARLPLALMMLGGVWIGAILGVLFTYHQVLRLRQENSRLRRLHEQVIRASPLAEKKLSSRENH